MGGSSTRFKKNISGNPLVQAGGGETGGSHFAPTSHARVRSGRSRPCRNEGVRDRGVLFDVRDELPHPDVGEVFV